ncbi:MAG: MATE family efflux transporter [Deltaproteobacteria bacterium]|nr:MATE family efflux transporter [Deltaproteobacteria bacterium]
MHSLDPRYRWNSPQGYRDLLRLCVPLVASSIAASVMMFTDRIFLANYSLEAIAASLPAGVMKFTITSIFIGIVGYTQVFVAQYTGAGQHNRAGATLWQGLYISLIFGFGHYFFFLLGPGLFTLAGHDPSIVALEMEYFRVLIYGTPLELMMVTMSAFLCAIGRARLVMLVNLAGMVLNIPLDYILIFGLGSGPDALIQPMGVYGAALATVFSWAFNFLLLSFFIFTNRMEKSHGTRSNFVLDWQLFKRLLRFGYPSGIQLFMEIFAFGFFAFVVGKLGLFYLSANNIVFSIEALSFFPMVGLGQAVSILVGNAIGRGAPKDGESVTVSGIVLSTSFVFIMLFMFLIFPEPLLGIFMSNSLDPQEASNLTRVGTIILRFVVIYCLFDGLYLCCFGAVKGAGDVWYPMFAMAFWAVVGLILPIIALFYLGWANIYSLWAVLVFYVLAVTATGVHRFLSRKWMVMKVIESVPSKG